MTFGRVKSLGTADLGVLALVAVTGVANLPIPFATDAAFFVTGARQLLAGEVLYRDFWDVKQPGVFWFYLAAGKLAGFDEIGIHVVELACMVAMAAVLLVTLREPFGSSTIARLAALLTVGAYYAVVGAHQLTQVEGLVGLPLLLCLWCALRATHRPGGAFGPLVLSGIAGGVALLFKLVFLPILLGLWMTALRGTGWPGRRPRAAGIGRWVFAAGLGLALPLGTAAAALGTQGVLDTALWTFFVYPFGLATQLSGVGEPGQLVLGVVWFGERFGPILALALIGTYAQLSARPGAAFRDSQLLVRGLLAWVTTGALVIVVQRKWWPYHFLLFLVPIGVLAALGIDAVWRRLTAGDMLRSARWAVGGALLLVFLAPITSLGQKIILLRHAVPGVSRERQAHYVGRFHPTYSDVLAETAFLRDPTSLPGAIYVFGDPLHYYAARRLQGAAIPGLWFEQYRAEMWDQLRQQLGGRLPAYILVTSNERTRYDREIAERAPGIMRLLTDRYHVLRSTPTGIWYERAVSASTAKAVGISGTDAKR